MSTLLLCALALVAQGMVQGGRLNHNVQALVALDEVALAISAQDFGAVTTPDVARTLIAGLGGKTVTALVDAGVPVVQAPPTDPRPSLWLEVSIYSADQFEGQLFRHFRVTLSLLDEVMVTRNREFLRAVVWRDEGEMSVATDDDLFDRIEMAMTTVCNRFADAYRVANGIR
jgi:hypothetical protein